MATIRKDKHGLYVRGRFYSVSKDDPAYRPGDFPSYSHAFDTSAGTLKEGDKVKSTHLVGSPLVKLRLDNGTVLYWGSHGRREGDFAETD